MTEKRKGGLKAQDYLDWFKFSSYTKEKVFMKCIIIHCRMTCAKIHILIIFNVEVMLIILTSYIYYIEV